MELYYRKIGKGPVVIVLHGLFGMSDNWLTVANNLSAHYTFYLLDLRNHGRSPHSTDFNYTLMNEDVKEFCLTHNLEAINLLGHSMGGKVAMSFANNYPGLLIKLIVVDIANRDYVNSVFEQYIRVLGSVSLTGMKTRKEVENALSGKLDANQEVVQFLLKNVYRDDHNKFKWRINLPVLYDNLDIILSKIEIEDPVFVPTLFIKGEKSNYISTTDERELKNTFINSRIMTIANANHWVHSSSPQHFLKVLHTFLNNNEI